MNLIAENIKVSIITASYNYEQYISETIDSVINQTYQNWELIIVDDGSVDSSLKIINSYVNKDSRIKLYVHKNHINRGLIETIKLALSKVSGEYIVFLEADDYISNDYISKKMEVFVKNPNIGLIYNDIKLIGNQNIIDERELYLNKIRNFWRKNACEQLCDAMHIMNMIPTFSCVMLKKSLLNQCSFNSPRVAWLDWWLWAQVVAKTKVYYINEELTKWRMHSNSYIKREKLNIEYYKSTYNFKLQLDRILPKVKSLKFLLYWIIKRCIQFLCYGTFVLYITKRKV